MRIRSPCHLTGLFIILCTVSVSLSLPGDQAANEHVNHHLLIERESGVQSSIQEDVSEIFDVNRLPNGTEIINSATQYFAGALGAYYSMPRSVIDIIRPGPLPYEQFLPILSDTLDSFLSEDESQTQTQVPPVLKRQVGGSDTQSNIQGNIQEIARNFITWLVPVLVVAVLSLVLAICFPCVGCCFCCCRLCGRCGGKAHRYRSNHQTTKCLIVSIIILLSAIFLLTGIVLGFLSNDKISTAIDSYTGTVDAAIQDGVNFVEDTLDEVTFIAVDELDNVLDSITDDINDVANILGNSLEIALEREAQPFIDGTNALLDQLTDLQNGFQGIDAQLGSLSSTVFQLNSSVLELQEALSNISTLCGGDPTCLSLIPQSQQIMLEFNENDLNVSDALSTLDNVNIGEIRELVDNTTQVFSNISGLLQEEIGEFDLPFNRSQFDSVTSVITSVQDTVDGIIGSNGTIGNIRDILLNDGDNYVSMFNTYRYGVVAAMFVAIFLIWVVYLIGLFCGVFGYSSKAPPYERSHVAHCGARLLLLGTALSFISGGLLLILTSFMYVSSTGMQKICNDLAPPEYTAFQRIFDDRQVWDGRTLVGNILHSQLGIDSNISISTFLRECESNSPLYEALQADSFFDIDELLSNFTNITNELDFSDNDFGSALNLSSSDFLPASTRQDLEALQSNIMNSINFTAYMDYLNENPLSFDLQEVFDNLTGLAALFTTNMMDAVANYTLEIRDDLVGTTINATIQDFNEIRNSLVANLTSLNSASQGIGVQVATVFESLDRFLNQSGTIITNEVDAYIDRIVDYVTSFIDFAVDAIKTEVGRCGSFTAAYTGLHITFCSKTLDGLNGFWFSVGWCAVFLIPLLISGAILTNYIRRSPSDVHSITDADDIGYDDTVISNPTVVNYSNQHGVEMVQLPNTPDVRVSHW